MTAHREPPSALNLTAFLDGLADRTPTPGGGSAAALAGALAAALARMVGAYSVGRKPDGEHSETLQSLCDQLAQADGMLRRLMDEDAAAYEALSAAQRAKRQGHDEPSAREQAVGVALAVPLETAAVAGSALTVMQQLLARANPHLLSDLGVAAVLADACVRAAAYSVRVNAPLLENAAQRREILEQVADVLRRAAATTSAIESGLPEAIRPTPRTAAG
ncbi:MAG: cyclodeaminase/cyclohydrolase family protein [Phycisphaerae bacterium]|nr:cyclodeaminase/cyclohydrolase family protein [Phycisphaerae bacterium]